MTEVNSYSDFISKIKAKGNPFFLIYKKGTEKSDCAFSNIRSAFEKVKGAHLFYADLNIVHDIHAWYNITTVPALLEFREGSADG